MIVISETIKSRVIAIRAPRPASQHSAANHVGPGREIDSASIYARRAAACKGPAQ